MSVPSPQVPAATLITVDNAVATVVGQIRAQISTSTPLNGFSLLTYGLSGMQIIEGIPQLSSEQKIQVLTTAIGLIIAASPLPAAEKSVLETIAPQIIPVFAQIVCLAAKGLTSINSKIKTECCPNPKCCKIL